MTQLAVGSETRQRHHRLQEALVGINPHLYGQDPDEARIALDRIKNVMHQPLHLLNAYRHDIFSPTLVRLPLTACPIPYCAGDRCPANTEQYRQVVRALAQFQTEIEPGLAWVGFTAQHNLARTTLHIPDTEQARIEQCK